MTIEGVVIVYSSSGAHAHSQRRALMIAHKCLTTGSSVSCSEGMLQSDSHCELHLKLDSGWS